MATTVDAFCSECFMPQTIEISPRYASVDCEYCGHSVDMFDKREIAAIRTALRGERSKMYIALLILAVAAAFFGFYVWLNLGDPEVSIPTPDGEPISGVVVSRDDTSITIRTKVGDERKFTFANICKDTMTGYLKERPYLSEEVAAAEAGAREIVASMPKPKMPVFLILAVLAGLAAVAFSFIAGQEKVVAEF
jgi:hypothetical protein